MIPRFTAPGLALALACAAVPAACQRHPAPRRVFNPPYLAEPGSPSRLRVRTDLWANLELRAATTSAVHATLVGYGRLGFAPDASYAVRVPFPSFVERVRVAVDDIVTRSQPLAELRSSDVARLRAEVANGQVALTTEQQTLVRLRRLVADGTANEREVAEARARLSGAQAQFDAARAGLLAAGVDTGAGDRYVLRAARGGRVLLRTMDPGERVTPDDAQPALVIGDPDHLVVRVAFPERDAVWLAEGLPCTFTVDAVGLRYEGTIVRIVRAVDPRTRSAEATCVPRAGDPRLASEMLARVEVPVTGAGAVVVPRASILLRRDEHVVFVRTAPGVLERRPVALGLSIGDQTQITHGLTAGDEVVTRGAVLLDGELEQLL